MSYKKQIRGDNSQANEQFAHNKIFIDMGAAGIILSMFAVILISSAIAWMMIRNGDLLSRLVILAFLAVFLGAGIAGTCFVVVFISSTIRQVRVNKILGQTIVAGEVVAYRNGEEWNHLSAEHEAAKVIPQLSLNSEEHEPLPSEAWVILDMHKQGIGFKAIAETTKWTEYAVRKLCNRVDGKVS